MSILPPASYPQLIVRFPVVTDQPITPNDIDYATYTNSVCSEIVAFETVMGKAPYMGLPYQTLQQAIKDLVLNKAPGHADSTGLVTTASGGHSHHHAALVENNSRGTHTQYIDVGGVNPITAPLTAPNAQGVNQLITLGQLLGFGFSTSIAGQLTTATASAVRGTTNVTPRTYTVVPWDAAGSTLWGIAGLMYGDPTLWPLIYNANRGLIGPNPNLIFTGMVLTIPDQYQVNTGTTVTGGYISGVTNESGNISFGFGGAFRVSVNSVTIIQMPANPTIGNPYNYAEDLLRPLFWNAGGCTVRYIDDAFINKVRSVAFSFIALGN